MNLNLKFKILENYGAQWRFAQDIDMHESDVSRVIVGRKQLPDETKAAWAKKLNCQVDEIFEV